MATIHSTSAIGQLKRLKSLVTNGFNVNSITHDNWTPLHRAVWNDQENVIRFLLDCTADCNIPNDKGRIPLHLAVIKGNLIAVILLIEHHSIISFKDKFNKTPLHYACKIDNPTIVKFLCEAGADVNATDSEGILHIFIGLQCMKLQQKDQKIVLKCYLIIRQILISLTNTLFHLFMLP